MGVIDEAAIDRLYLIGELSKHICVSSSHGGGGGGGGGGVAGGGSGGGGDTIEGGGDVGEMGAGGSPELASFFPPFLWLLRDFVLELRDANGRALDPNEYMEKALEPRPSGARRWGAWVRG
jgi:hypothetical protein